MEDTNYSVADEILQLVHNGDLQERIRRNAKRLSAPEYCAPLIFRQGGDWPGDWQGRALLALCCNYKTCTDGNEAERMLCQADKIISGLDGEINQDGYFGEVFTGTTVNEQQLSGNSWFLRGLTEYYELTGSKKAFAVLRKITDNLLVKLAPFYRNYPLKAARQDGGVSGSLVGDTNGWLLSSDIGCAFIMLDGLSAVYALTKDKRLEEVVETAVARFLQIDFVESKCQTHAVLSALRGILRYGRTKGTSAYEEHVLRIFDLYLQEGRTINYANYNWFTRPLWTEPCAVTDSLILCRELFLLTGNDKYIGLLNRIYYNAFRAGMRPNGGAGCETCLTDENRILRTHMYEAFFCCSMRIAEGLKSLCNSCFLRRENTITLALFDDCEISYRDGTAFSLRKEGEMAEGTFSLILKARLADKRSVRVYLPPQTEVRWNGNALREGDFLAITESGDYTFEFVLSPHREGTVYFAGDLLLTQKKGWNHAVSPFVFQEGVRILSPIADCMRLSGEQEVLDLIQEV